MDQGANGLRSPILDCKASASSCNDEVCRVLPIAPLAHGTLDLKKIIWDDRGLMYKPLITTLIIEHFGEYWTSFVGRGILVRRIRYYKDTRLHACLLHVTTDLLDTGSEWVCDAVE